LNVHRASGLSLAAFARRHQLSLQRLYSWHRRLQHATDAAADGPRFLPVRVVSSEPLRTADTIEIVLRGDRRVRVSGEFEAATLARVVEVLEHVAC
jgi:hypothetical protein